MSNQFPQGDVCCAPLAQQAISAEDAAALAKAFKAIGDPVRLQLFSAIASAPGELCVCDLPTFELSAPTISHHLKVLREVGLVGCERRGTFVFYWAVPEAMRRLSAVLVPRV
ncbi:metalloregulator ArsR/SmtB family transcription factor [Actinocorallia lasiicapitis]